MPVEMSSATYRSSYSPKSKSKPSYEDEIIPFIPIHITPAVDDRALYPNRTQKKNAIEDDILHAT